MSNYSKSEYSFKNRLKTKHKNLVLRSNIIQLIRSYFIENGYIEVETPIRIQEPTPEAFIDSILSENFYLHTSPELSMKKLIASGFTKIFQICKCFRANERSEIHLSEFTLLEWYRCNASYMDLMDECERLITYIATNIALSNTFDYQGHSISLNFPWKRITVSKAFDMYATVSLRVAMEKDQFDEVMVYEIEPALGKQPVFLYDYPKERAALAQLKPDNKNFAERFELYIAGYELANAFSELTDSDEQRKRFLMEIDERKSFGKPTYPIPESFLKSIKYLPETGGIALGIDRLIMIFADVARIDDVVAFTSEELTI